MKLQEFEFDIEYIRGENNPADSISRYINEVEISEKQSLNEEDKRAILEDYHLNSGHGSSSTMKFMIKQKYQWHGMYKDIDKFVSECTICLKGGYENRKRGSRIIKTEGPNDLWQVDLIGYLDETSRKNKYIFVAIDHFSKWVETAPLKNKSKEAVAFLIKSLIIDKHGAPRQILTDNGLEFVNKEFSSLLTKYGIQHRTNSPGHHETMGAVERANQSLFNKLKKLCNFGSKQWDMFLKQATLGMNFSFHRALRTSPYIFKYGKLPDLNIDKKLGIIDKTVSLKQVRDIRNANFEEYSLKHINKEKNIWNSTLKEGDKVLVFKKPLGKKLLNSWTPGFTIARKASEDSFIVKNRNTEMRVNKHNIKKDLSEGGGVSYL
ncbi:hypothetical protein ENBRE01_0871 [Enteropsectra breve]|nr:hypothetical protein ENBRE01_0871 [Enteropsectra breve]